MKPTTEAESNDLCCQPLRAIRHKFFIETLVLISVLVLFTIVNYDASSIFQNFEPKSKLVSVPAKDMDYEETFKEEIPVADDALKLLASEDKILLDRNFIPTAKKKSSKTDNVKEVTSSCKRQLPKVLMIGVPKCGTAALLSFLRFHPNISTNMSEFNFFSNSYDLGLDWYRNQMPCSSAHQLTIERSTEYFYKGGVPERVQKLNKNMKLLLSVCEPVRRTVSQFAMFQANGYIPLNITAEQYFLNSSALKGIFGLGSENFVLSVSNYSRHFASWLRYFPLKNIHLIDGDIFARDPYKVITAIEQFLGLEPYIKEENFIFNATKGFYCFNKPPKDSVKTVEELSSTKGVHCLPPSKGRKHPEIGKQLESFLKSHFKSLNKAFYKLCKRNFNW